MRVREVTAEAWTNIATGASRPLVLAGLLAIAFVFGVLASSHQAVNSILAHHNYFASGAATTIIRAMGAINPHYCATLAEVEGVQGAFAARQLQQQVYLAVLPSFGQPRFEVVGSVTDTLGGDDSDGGGVLISRPFAERLGVSPGDAIAFADAQPTIAAVFDYPDDGRTPLLSTAILTPTPGGDGAYDQCWLTIWPPRAEYQSLYTSVVNGSSLTLGDIEIQQLNGSLGPPKTLTTRLAESHVHNIQLIAIAMSALIGAAWVWSRRVEFAMSLHLGQTRSALTMQSVIEGAVVGIVIAGAALTAAVIASTSRLQAQDVLVVGADSATTSLGMLVALISGIIISVSFIDEASLQKWSKDR